MKETGLVINIKNGLVTVKVERDAPGSCCKMDGKAAFFIEAHNLCDAAINNKVSVETGNTFSPSMKLLLLGLCIFGFILGLLSGDKLSGFPFLAAYKDYLSLGLGISLALITFLGFRHFSTRGKNTFPVVSAILSN